MVKEQVSVLYIHIPKCGGTSFEKGMSDRGWRELLSVRGVNAKDLTFLRCSPQHMHADLLTEIVVPEFMDKVLTIVRDPLARLKSEFAWQRVQGITRLGPEDWVRHVFTEFRENPFVYDNHIRPQHEFLLPEAKVFKLEEDGVNRALDYAAPGKHEGILKTLFAAKAGRKMKATSKALGVDSAFRKLAVEIEEFYEQDYALLGYRRGIY